MESTRPSNESKRQRETGLPTAQYQRYLVSIFAVNSVSPLTCLQEITVRVAKDLVLQPVENKQYSWRDVTFPMGETAITRVNTALSAEGINALNEDTITSHLDRLLKGIRWIPYGKVRYVQCV